jgi:hypothetical protein
MGSTKALKLKEGDWFKEINGGDLRWRVTSVFGDKFLCTSHMAGREREFDHVCNLSDITAAGYGGTRGNHGQGDGSRFCYDYHKP